MSEIKISETLSVTPAPDMVIVWSTDACNAEGETFPFEIHLTLWPDEAVAFANAILHAAANLPEADLSHLPADLYLEDGSLNPDHAS